MAERHIINIVDEVTGRDPDTGDLIFNYELTHIAGPVGGDFKMPPSAETGIYRAVQDGATLDYSPVSLDNFPYIVGQIRVNPPMIADVYRPTAESVFPPYGVSGFLDTGETRPENLAELVQWMVDNCGCVVTALLSEKLAAANKQQI